MTRRIRAHILLLPVVLLTGGVDLQAAGSTNSAIDPRNYGAICDGATDDSAAFRLALDAVPATGGALLIPASARGCKLDSTLAFDTSDRGPLTIYGDGSVSKLLIANKSGGLLITGNCGRSANPVYLRHFQLQAGSLYRATFAIHLAGLATFGIDDVDVNGSLVGFEYGIQLSGAQQGYIHGGASGNNGTGIYLEDCGRGTASTASSNGVDIGGGRTFSDKTAAVDIEGGAADVWVHNVHITNSLYGVINNQTDVGGSGPNYFSQIHLEANTVYGVDDRAGVVVIEGANDYNVHSIHVYPKGRLIANNSLFDGIIRLDENSHVVFTNNIVNRYIDVRTLSSNIVQFNNIGNYAPRSFPTIFNTAGRFSSSDLTAGDILLLTANPSIAGAWGMTINGSGTDQQVYLRLNDVALAGSTNGGVMRILSGPGGEQWAEFARSGLSLAGSAKTSVTTVGALGACSFTNEGTHWAVSDAHDPVVGMRLTGGGTSHVPAYCNGTAWIDQ